MLRAAFIPFGDISEVQLPIDYQTEKHRGFAFIDFELPEDAQAAIDNMVSKAMMVRSAKQVVCSFNYKMRSFSN